MQREHDTHNTAVEERRINTIKKEIRRTLQVLQISPENYRKHIENTVARNFNNRETHISYVDDTRVTYNNETINPQEGE